MSENCRLSAGVLCFVILTSCYEASSIIRTLLIIPSFDALHYIRNILMGHIGRVDKTSISRYRIRLFKSSTEPICCVLKQDTLTALLQSTQLTNVYQSGTSL